MFINLLQQDDVQLGNQGAGAFALGDVHGLARQPGDEHLERGTRSRLLSTCAKHSDLSTIQTGNNVRRQRQDFRKACKTL